MKKAASLFLALVLTMIGLTVPASAKTANAPADLKTFVAAKLDYFVGSVEHTPDIAATNEAVRQMVLDAAGKNASVSSSIVVDKNAMVPRSQQYYQPGVPGGICNKAAAMMLLSYYRDGKGFSNLPSDAVMYEELSGVYAEITAAYPSFFTSAFMKNQFDVTKSYEMPVTFESGIAWYLYSKGYKDTAAQVLENIGFSLMRLPKAAGDAFAKVVLVYFSRWLSEKTNGELSLPAKPKAVAGHVIENSLKNGEPVIIGCLTALGNDIYSAHYFVAVGYYRTRRPAGLAGKSLFTVNREYVEVYDTWGQSSSVVDWTVFKNTALYSSTSIAEI